MKRRIFLVCLFYCFFRRAIYESIAAILWQSASYVSFVIPMHSSLLNSNKCIYWQLLWNFTIALLPQFFLLKNNFWQNETEKNPEPLIVLNQLWLMKFN